MLESTYQAGLIRRLHRMFPGCIVLKNDTSYQQGIPDLLILFNDRWALLEVKRAHDSDEEPNQRYFIEKADAMSFGAFIFPENEQDVLHDLQLAFQVSRRARVSQRK